MSDTTPHRQQSKTNLVGTKRVTLEDLKSSNDGSASNFYDSSFINDLLAQFGKSLYYRDLKQKPFFKSLGTQTINTTEVPIVHGLPRTPNVVIIQMTSAGGVYQSTPADSTKIYLKADSSGRTCNVEVAYILDNLI